MAEALPARPPQLFLRKTEFDGPDSLETSWRDSSRLVVDLLAHSPDEAAFIAHLQGKAQAAGPTVLRELTCGIIFGILTDPKTAPLVCASTHCVCSQCPVSSVLSSVGAPACLLLGHNLCDLSLTHHDQPFPPHRRRPYPGAVRM